MKVVVFNMEFYKNYTESKYFLKADNKIFDIKFAGIEYIEIKNDKCFCYLSYPSYFVFNCKYEYCHREIALYYREIFASYLRIPIKINLYCDCGSYYIKFIDLFRCFNDNLIISLCINDYKRLKKYKLYDEITDLAKYIKINFGLDVRKD